MAHMPAFALVLALAATAIGSLGIVATSMASSEVAVSIVARAYQPPQLTIEAGQTVTWTNHGFTPHTVTALAGQFDSGPLSVGETFKVSFTTPGTFPYMCTIHPSMRGTVTVLAPGQAAQPEQGSGGAQASLKVSLARVPSVHGRLTLVRVQAPRPGAAVLLQLRYASGIPWRTVRRARLSSTGNATLTLAASSHHRLRVIVQGAGRTPSLISKALVPSA